MKRLPLAVALCVTLGLAPFSPEPHLWGKLKWVFGGAKGMGFMDWFDLILHGSPWVFLIIVLVQQFLVKKK